ncbi:hypothetical protein [Methylobacterium segetis]|uniref:hypothetical protein n=1 Tax=Methylobacterium segetis TaxID=2488750 RepID=UPI001049EBAB|nr:hypothetical protein [Methylobacterium segetis]
MYWDWLKGEACAKQHPLYDMTVKKQLTEAEEERPYTGTEVQILFMGEPPMGGAWPPFVAIATANTPLGAIFRH